MIIGGMCCESSSKRSWFALVLCGDDYLRTTAVVCFNKHVDVR